MNQNRRDRRAAARGRRQQPPPGDVVSAIIMRDSGHVEEMTKARDLPPKVPGQHRWIATVLHAVPESMVAMVFDPGEVKLLDRENRIAVYFGCWDCEKPLGEIQPGSPCPAENEW